MNEMNAYAFAILTNIAGYFVVGNFAGRKPKRLEDYFVAGRQAPILMIVGTRFASFVSPTFLGNRVSQYLIYMYDHPSGIYLYDHACDAPCKALICKLIKLGRIGQNASKTCRAVC